ncbi:MAG TPA: nucleoside recognition domain-containing protein [Egibacteraceae bacterium]|jgi:ferrous iron transport protein B|nr:nucleoside recognition domain-containing protein [Egibacteraceae bacterium]
MVTSAPTVVLVGAESAGKSTLAATLTGGRPRGENLRGSTVAVECYHGPSRTLVDTPGLVRGSDAATIGAAIKALGAHDTVLVCAAATRLDDHLVLLLPLLAGKRAAVAVTFWDKVNADERACLALAALSTELGVPVVGVDARYPSAGQAAAIDRALAGPGQLTGDTPRLRVGWRIDPRPTVLERRRVGPTVAALALVIPSVVAVWAANLVAGLAQAPVEALTERAAALVTGWPFPLAEIVAGDFGLLTMGPLLLVWALPTVAVYALLLGAYKTSGLADRLTAAVHPLVRPVGLEGRDVVRVLMGFGCNVPAVVATRSCSGCSRDTTIAAIAFGSACSYQLGATLAVLAAGGRPGLVWPYLVVLVSTTLLYTCMVADPAARARRNLLLLDRRAFLVWPRAGDVWREASGSLGHFLRQAVPVFMAIAVVASLLAAFGLLDVLSGALAPVMGAVALPPEAALPTVMAAIRKDGILLLAEPSVLAALSGGQLLTAVYLAGVALPCLVTALTIARERGWRRTAALVARQLAAAVMFAALLGWGLRALGW